MKLVIFLLLVTAWARADEHCTILGCTDGEVKVSKYSSEWTFEFLEKFYLTNPILDGMGEALRKEGLIGVHDRVDLMSFTLAAKDCVEARELGTYTCIGKIQYPTIRVRRNETYLSEEAAHKFQWELIHPKEDSPWIFEIRKVNLASGPELITSVKIRNTHHEIYPVPLYQCRHTANRPDVSSTYKSCRLWTEQGSAMADLYEYLNWDHVSFRLSEHGDGFAPMAITRALKELGVLSSLEMVTAITYSTERKNCSGTTTLTCQQNTKEIGVTTVTSDKNGLQKLRERTIKLDGITAEAGKHRWEWTFYKDDKVAGTGPLPLNGCLQGEE